MYVLKSLDKLKCKYKLLIATVTVCMLQCVAREREQLGIASCVVATPVHVAVADLICY